MFDLNTKILVIDDMGTMRKIVMKACKDLGFTQFVEAADGALGWQTLNDNKGTIGLIISDWNMPNCTGLELLKRVRGDNRYAALPFVLVTAEAEQGQIIDAMKAGVSGYVIKPFTPDTLKTCLETAHAKVTRKKAA